MHPPHLSRSRATVAPALGIAWLVALSACSPPSDRSAGKEEGENTPAETIDSRPTHAWTLPGARVDLSLHRVDDEHMVAQMTLTNEGDQELPGAMESLYTLLADEFYGADERMFNGVAWLDPGGRVLHKPYLDEDGTCLCSNTSGAIGLTSAGEGGDTWEGYAVLEAPPDDVEELTVVTRVAPPFVNVPVRHGPPDGLDYRAPEDNPNAEPQPAELESVTDADEETVIEDNETTDLNLSTDVLFEVEESELTSEADTLIEDVATRIEEIGATEVTVEGHADSAGDDTVNDPLSQDRADAVRDGLAEHIEADIDYNTEGYGSDEPIASNDTEVGREKNRRVTISVPRGTPTEQDEENEDTAEPDQGEGTPASEVSVTGPADDLDRPDVEVTVDLTDLRAVTDSTALLTYRVTNPNDADVQVGLDMGVGWMDFRAHATHAVSIDSGDGTAHPLRVQAPEGGDHRPSCLCTSSSGSDLGSLIISAEQSHEYYTFLPITPGSNVTTITFGEIGAAEDVAIQQ